MPSFQDSIFIFILALLLFGPKKLPKLARELGKWVGEFRRASNEFKMQMEEELRMAEQADKQKEIAAMEAAAPVTPAIPATVVPALPVTSFDDAGVAKAAEATEQQILRSAQDDKSEKVAEELPEPLPIAVSGDLKIMPPATGLPKPRGAENGNALGGLLESIPSAEATPEEERAAHGD